MTTTIQEDLVCTGAVNFAGASTMTHKSGSIANADVIASAGIDYDKLDHFELVCCSFDQAIGATPTVREQIVFTARSAGVLQSVHFGLNDTGTSTDIDFDINVNGTTAMSGGVQNITHATADRVHVAGTLTTTALVTGDVVSVEIQAVTSSTGAQGAFCVVGISYATPA
jgi:hypothetical protein